MASTASSSPPDISESCVFKEANDKEKKSEEEKKRDQEEKEEGGREMASGEEEEEGEESASHSKSHLFPNHCNTHRCGIDVYHIGTLSHTHHILLNQESSACLHSPQCPLDHMCA